MALRSAATRIFSRRASSLAESMDKAATKGPKLPIGNDPSAFHDVSHAAADSNRWRLISFVFFVPVTAFGILKVMDGHEHIEPPPDYPYLKMANRVPRFPWGEDDLIGTSYERHAKAHAEGKGH